jgi:hypothetical protein
MYIFVAVLFFPGPKISPTNERKKEIRRCRKVSLLIVPPNDGFISQADADLKALACFFFKFFSPSQKH